LTVTDVPLTLMSAVAPAGTSMNVARMPVSWEGVTLKTLMCGSLPRSHSTLPPSEVPVTSELTTSAVPLGATAAQAAERARRSANAAAKSIGFVLRR
jgi:hypothetical protein